MNQPLISIVTIVYNGARQLEKTIESVLYQTYPHIEYIIVDGGSTDGTLAIIKSYENRLAKWISEPDKGIYDAMNKGIDLATGKWINFMNCGDQFISENVVEKISKYLGEAHDIVYGDAIVLYPTFNTKLKTTPVRKLWKGMSFCHQAAFVRTALMKEFKFDLSYKVSGDFDFLYRMHVAKKEFFHVKEDVCYYDYKEGTSKKMVILSAKERQKSVLREGFNLKKWLYYASYKNYLLFTLFIKRILGDKTTGSITRMLRNR